MALPETNNDIQFRELKKSTGKITLQLVINRRVFWKRLDAASVGKKAYFKCEKKDTLNCPATAQAVLLEEATDTTSRKYVCSNFSNNHNHDIDEEDSLVKAAHRSLKAEILSQPFGRDLHRVYHDWYAAYSEGLPAGERETFVGTFPAYNNLKCTLYR